MPDVRQVTLKFDLKLNSLVRKIGVFDIEGRDYRDMLEQFRTDSFHYEGELESFEVTDDLDIFVVIYCRGESDELTLSVWLDDDEVVKKRTFEFSGERGVIHLPAEQFIA